MSRRARRTSWLVLLAVVVVIAAFSNSFGRAEPEGRYRPLLQNAALDTGCYPLPDGVHFDFAHQVRNDGDVETPDGLRRHLTVQWDLIGLDELRPLLTESFTRAGFTVVSESEDRAEVTSPGSGRVSWTLTPFDVDEDVLVRGSIELDLPVVARSSDHPQCFDPFTTKRFADSETS